MSDSMGSAGIINSIEVAQDVHLPVQL